MKMFIILQLVSYRMIIVIFKLFAGKMCNVVSPLPQDFYANFGGDPLLMTHRMTTSCWPKIPGMGWILSFITGKCTTGSGLFSTISRWELWQKGLKICLWDIGNLRSIKQNQILVGLISWDCPFKLSSIHHNSFIFYILPFLNLWPTFSIFNLSSYS